MRQVTYDDLRVPRCDLRVVILGDVLEGIVACLMGKGHIRY